MRAKIILLLFLFIVFGLIVYLLIRYARVTNTVSVENNLSLQTKVGVGGQNKLATLFTDSNGFTHSFGIESAKNIFPDNFILNGRWAYGKLKDYSFDTLKGEYRVVISDIKTDVGNELTFLLPLKNRRYSLSTNKKSIVVNADELEQFFSKAKFLPIGLQVGIYVETPFGYPKDCVKSCEAYIDEVRFHGKDFDVAQKEYYGVIGIDLGKNE